MDEKERKAFDRLLEAAEATMKLWIYHGLGDNEDESGPVWDMLQNAILEGRKFASEKEAEPTRICPRCHEDSPYRLAKNVGEEQEYYVCATCGRWDKVKEAS